MSGLVIPPVVTVGSGQESLAFTVSEQGAPAGAEFTITVDGTQIGGVQTTTADSTAGQTQVFDVLGSFVPGYNTAYVDYVNYASVPSSVLSIDSAAINGATIPGAAFMLNANAAVEDGFSFTAPSSPPPVIGVGPDTLTLTTSEQGQPSGAHFTVDVDGVQVGGVQTTTADGAAGQSQTLDVLGSFAPGPHTVSVNYLNASNSQLDIGSATINGATIAGAPQVLSSVSSAGFSFVGPPTFKPASVKPSLEAGESGVIGTATPSEPGDTLAIGAAGQSAGTFSLGAVQADGSQPVIYTAPAAPPLFGTFYPSFTITDEQQGVSASGFGSVTLDFGPAVSPTSASLLADTLLQPGQSEVIATVYLGEPADTLSVVQTAGAGSVTLGANNTVVYTAPATLTNTVDNVAYTIRDQHDTDTINEAAALPLSTTGSIPISQINTPLVGAAGSLFAMAQGAAGQAVSETVAGYALSLPAITPQVTGGAGGAGYEFSGGGGGNATLTIQQDDLGEYVSTGVTLSASATGGVGGNSETEGPGDGGGGGPGGTAMLLADSITARLGGPTTITLGATGGAGGEGGSSDGGAGGPAGGGSPATVTLSNSTVEVDGAGETSNDVLQVAITATGGAGGGGGSSGYSNAGRGGDGSSATASLTGDTLGGVMVAISLTAGGGAGGPGGSSELESGPLGGPPASTPGSASITFTGNSVGVFPGAPIQTIGSDALGTLIGTEGELALSLSESSAGQPVALTAAAGGNLTFTGNSFTGQGDDTFALSLGSGSYVLDAAAGSLSIAGSASNAITGFDLFDMQGVTGGTNSFAAGTGLELLELGGGTTTVAVTPQSGSLGLSGATASGLVLDLTGFGGTFNLAQLTADTSEINGNEVVALPDGQAITIVGAPVAFTAANTRFAPPSSGPVTLGSGDSTLSLFLSERAQPAGAQFTISVDGTQVGGVQTVTADMRAGQEQQYNVLGNDPDGVNTVTIRYLNADQSLLLVDNAVIDNVPIANSTATLSNTGSAGFSFIATGSLTPVSIGSGPDTLALFMSERAQPAGAEFVVSVDGTQIGGIQTTTADVLAGQSQEFDVNGAFPSGTNTVSITDLNAADSVLSLDNATFNGMAVLDGSVNLSNDGSASFGFTGPSANAPVTIGSGADILAITLSERAQPTGAEFTIDVDGAQAGGVQTTTADVLSGQSQVFDVLGDFAPGPHTVDINDLNASNSLLDVDTATIDGSTIAGTPQTLDNIGSLAFSFVTPAAPTPTLLGTGTGPDTLALTLSEDDWQANANIMVSVDGTPEGGTQTVTAVQGNGQSQVFDVAGNFSGTHTVAVNFLNAAASGGTASNLSIGGATIDGASIPNSTLTLNTNGAATFTFTH